MLPGTDKETLLTHLLPCDMGKFDICNKHPHEWRRFVQFKDSALEIPELSETSHKVLSILHLFISRNRNQYLSVFHNGGISDTLDKKDLC